MSFIVSFAWEFSNRLLRCLLPALSRSQALGLGRLPRLISLTPWSLVVAFPKVHRLSGTDARRVVDRICFGVRHRSRLRLKQNRKRCFGTKRPGYWSGVRGYRADYNNAAKRALCHAVIWRKVLFGTQSRPGSHFVAHLLTVIESYMRQSRGPFSWLVEAVQAHMNGGPSPSLFPTL